MDIEKIYNEFTTNMLPQIQEGLTITKEYFTDLFGRYVQFLLVMDLVHLFITLTFVVVIPLLAYYLVKKYHKDIVDNDLEGMYMFAIFPFIFWVFLIFGTIDFFEDVVKTIYLPEVRVYEELTNYINNDNN